MGNIDSWGEELSVEERDAVLRKAADAILRRRLEAPAILLLQSNKPLARIGSQATIVFAPFLVPFFGFDNIRTLSSLLADRENVEMLITLLEEGADRLPKEMSA